MAPHCGHVGSGGRSAESTSTAACYHPPANQHDHGNAPHRYGGTSKATGAPLDAPFCHVYRFAGDKVATFQQYTDTAQWARAMGA